MRFKPLSILLAIFFLMFSAACNVSTPETIQTTASQTPPMATPTHTFPAPTITEEPKPEETEVPTPEVTEIPVLGEPALLNTIHMVDDAQGWAVANARNSLLHTLDGGITWQDVTPYTILASQDYYSLSLAPYFLDAQNVWFTTPEMETSRLLHSDDAGSSWQETNLPFGSGQLYFLDSDHGYILVDLGAGAGSHYVAIYYTSDGGLNWMQRFSHEPGMSMSLPESGSKSGLTILDLNKAWIGGSTPIEDYTYLYRSIDGAQNWQKVNINLPDVINRIFIETWQPFFVDDQTGYVPLRVLQTSDDFLLLFCRSIDGGETWQYLSTVPNGTIYDFIDAMVGWASDGLSLYSTTDGAQTWSVLASDLPAIETILQIDFVSDQVGWLRTTPDADTWETRHLFKTEDGGESWVLLPAVVFEASDG